MDYLINIVPFVIIGVILFYALKKQKRKEDKYFGKEVPLTKKELKILEKYKAEYTKILHDDRLPTFEKDGFELVDIAKSATEMVYDHPIPSRIEKEQVDKGKMVKLKVITQENEIERMWVEVVEKDGNILKGILKNDSLFNNELFIEKEIWFHINHIFEIENN